MESVYARVTARIVKSLESGETLPWRKPWFNPVPANASGRKYNGLNRLVLSCSEFEDHRWVTFRQAQDLGGSVRKGEKGTSVLLWKKLLSESEEETEAKKKSGLLCHGFTVFNIAQCDGLKLPELPNSNVTSTDVFTTVSEALNLFDSCPPIQYGGRRACYNVERDEIRMPEPDRFATESDWANVLCHELAHSTGHPSRLARFDLSNPNPRGETKYAFEELVAQISADFVCAELGIVSDDKNSEAYIECWLRGFKEKKFFLSSAATRAQRAADMILGRQPR